MNRRGFISGLMALIAWPFARRTEKPTKIFVPPNPDSREWQWITLEIPATVKAGESYIVPVNELQFRYGERI